MRHPLVGIGAAGIVSTVAFTLFIFGESSNIEISDIMNTSVLLGLAFGAILAVGLATMAKNLRSGKQEIIASKSDWTKTCPRCGTFLRKRRNFCPNCGEDLRYDDVDP